MANVDRLIIGVALIVGVAMFLGSVWAYADEVPPIQQAVAPGTANEIPAAQTQTRITAKNYGFKESCQHGLFNLGPRLNSYFEYRDAQHLADEINNLWRQSGYCNVDFPKTSIDPFCHVETIYLGKPEGYAEILLRNESATERSKAELDVAMIFALGASILTRSTQVGDNIMGQQAPAFSYDRQGFTISKLKDLPPGVTKILTVRVYCDGAGFKGKFQETLTAAYNDVSDEQLRKINWEEGVKRVIRLKD